MLPPFTLPACLHARMPATCPHTCHLPASYLPACTTFHHLPSSSLPCCLLCITCLLPATITLLFLPFSSYFFLPYHFLPVMCLCLGPFCLFPHFWFLRIFIFAFILFLFLYAWLPACPYVTDFFAGFLLLHFYTPFTHTHSLRYLLRCCSCLLYLPLLPYHHRFTRWLALFTPHAFWCPSNSLPTVIAYYL